MYTLTFLNTSFVLVPRNIFFGECCIIFNDKLPPPLHSLPLIKEKNQVWSDEQEANRLKFQWFRNVFEALTQPSLFPSFSSKQKYFGEHFNRVLIFFQHEDQKRYISWYRPENWNVEDLLLSKCVYTKISRNVVPFRYRYMHYIFTDII